MLQRVQTLYVLGAIVAFVLMIFFPLGTFTTNGNATLPLGIFGVQTAGIFRPVFIVSGIFIVSLLCEVIIIFIYGNRVLQMRFTIFNCVLQLGFYIAIAAYVMVFNSDMHSSFSMGWTIFLPLVTLILNLLAFKAIHKDEKLVRSLDHLR